MLQQVICCLALVAVCVSGFLPLEEDAQKCKPMVPYMKNFVGEWYAGRWYVDSAAQEGWLHSVCNEYHYRWHHVRREGELDDEDEEESHHRHHGGYFTFNLREINKKNGTTIKKCWTACGNETHGFINGSLHTDHDGRSCNFREEQEVEDPPHPHKSCPANQKPNWSQWIIHTDYLRYSLVWLCTENRPYISLQSRDKFPLSPRIRRAAQRYLDNHGYKHKLKPASNKGC